MLLDFILATVTGVINNVDNKEGQNQNNYCITLLINIRKIKPRRPNQPDPTNFAFLTQVIRSRNPSDIRHKIIDDIFYIEYGNGEKR